MEALKEAFGDAFVTLPLLIIGFVFFLGTLTSNIGLLYLFIGHLIVVPILAFLGNEAGPFYMNIKNGQTDITKILKWLFAVLVFFGIQGASLQSATNSDNSFLLYLLVLIPAFGQVFYYSKDPAPEKQKSALFFFNPPAWFLEPAKTSDAANCNMLPHSSPEDFMYNTPSNWVNHIVFFFGFIIANAIAIYNEPTPTVTASVDAATMKNMTENISKRVTRRKWLAGTITAVAIIVLIVLLIFRYNKTECEQKFWIAFIPVLIAVLTGSSWFNLVYTKCGVRPTDVLGIVQGMIAPELIDNPIVCVGS